MVQWLRLRVSTAGGVGLFPSWGSKMLHGAAKNPEGFTCMN